MSRSLAELISLAWENHVLLNLMLELTYACDLRCSFCYNDRTRRGRPLTLEKYRELLADARRLGSLYLTLTGGEPTLHKDFFSIGQFAKEQGYSIRIKSHGAYPDGGIIRKIKSEIDPFGMDISIHGADAATHDALTRVPGSFDRLIKNLEMLNRVGLRTSLRCVITRLNQWQLEEILKIGETFGMPVQFTAEVTARDDGDPSPFDLAPDFEGVVHYFSMIANMRDEKMDFVDMDATDRYRSLLVTRYNCGAGTGSLTVDPYGDVLPCVAWRRPLGSLWNLSVREIWEGSDLLSGIRVENEKARKFKEKHDDIIQGLLFCPGRAEREKGNPLTSYEDLVTMGNALKEAKKKKEENE